MTTDAHHPEDAAKITRRRMLGWTVAGFGTAWTALALYPIYRYLNSAAHFQQASAVTEVSLGDPAKLPVNQGQNFQFGNIPGILVHAPQDNSFHAYNAVCTHLGCTVQYRPDKQLIWCACHGGQYDPVTGKVLAGPPPRPLEAFKVATRNNQIVVSAT
jgi:cytochrome b6-f complex iron-sulfur subunit